MKKLLIDEFPDIAAEWDYEKNKDFDINKILCNSQLEAWWKCINNHNWKQIVQRRVKGCHDCKFCKYSFAIRYPELFKEWDYIKNIGIDVKIITCRSETLFWWLCSNGHSFEQSVTNRLKHGIYCKYCRREEELKTNSVAVVYPELLKDWDYNKNELSPDKITYGYSASKIWWKCELGHSYDLSISNKINSIGCPYCTKQKASIEYCFGTLYPDLIEIWDNDKNTLTPYDVTPKSHKIVYLKCKKNHSWSMMVFELITNSSCKKCYLDDNNLELKYPNIAKDWDYDKNGNLKPSEVLYGTTLRVHWKCEYGHEWNTQVCSRIAQETGCPSCSNRVVTDTNNLEVNFPEIAKEWNYEKNGDLLPNQVIFGSNIVVWWRCSEKNHEWFTSVASRTQKNSGCLYCCGHLVKKEDSFGSKYKELLEEWDYDKNTIDPYEVTPFSHKIAAWKCKKNHTWSIEIYQRSMGTGCPGCVGGSFSKIGISILEKISKDKNIHIQHALNGGEYKIKLNTIPNKTIKVDGYCKENNTIYEVNGCFVHAHTSSKCYLRRNWTLFTKHPYGGTYGDKYIATLEREVMLSKMGYKVVVLWECDCRIMLGLKK